MWCYARDVDEFREQAGAVIEAYNKATAAGALQSKAERAAAAIAYKIDPGYRTFINDSTSNPPQGTHPLCQRGAPLRGGRTRGVHESRVLLILWR